MAALGGRGIPLRVGLVAATLVLVACGLLASGIAVTTILRHDLTNRVDETLLDAGAAADAGAAERRTESRPAAVELLRARRRSRRAHLDGGQRPRGRARAARRQRRGSRAGNRRLDRPLEG